MARGGVMIAIRRVSYVIIRTVDFVVFMPLFAFAWFITRPMVVRVLTITAALLLWSLIMDGLLFHGLWPFAAEDYH